MKMWMDKISSTYWGIVTIGLGLVLSVAGDQDFGDLELETIRDKRGAAYAGPHPGGGYGVGGVGIPGINSIIQYSAYDTLLNSGQHGGSSYGGGGHGRKLTVDEAIGLFGHHQTSQPYPYTSGHNPGGSQSGYGNPGRNLPIVGATHGSSGYQSSGYAGTGIGHRGGGASYGSGGSSSGYGG